MIPIKRVHLSTVRAHQWRAWSVATWVEWCGHQQEVVLVPGDWVVLGDSGVLGAAT